MTAGGLPGKNALVDREEIERRFRDRVLRFREEYFWFLAGAVVVSVAVAAGAGFAFYVLATWFWAFFARSLPPSWAVVAAYVVFGIGVGYAQYRRRPAVRGQGEGMEFSVLRDMNLFYILLSLPGLIFHFIHELVSGRHLFATEEVERLAFEVLVDGGERISPVFLQAKLAEDPAGLHRAIQLLLEMKLLVFARHGRRERSLLRSLEGMDFVAGGP